LATPVHDLPDELGLARNTVVRGALVHAVGAGGFVASIPAPRIVRAQTPLA
jgi:hypothetical protein